MDLGGIHHVTAVSGHIAENVDFYTKTLGMRLVKKSVNQDDVSAYHLFYADKVGSPGTDMTFFDWPHIGTERRGTDSIVATAFRVKGSEALAYWKARFDELEVAHDGIETFDGRGVLRFEDPEGQRLLLVDDQGEAYEGEVWDGSDVSPEFAIRGFYAVMLSVINLEQMAPLFTQLLNFREARRSSDAAGREVVIYHIGAGGPGRELWVIVEPDKARAQLGAGGVHHVAFRVADDGEQQSWRNRLTEIGLPVSGFIDRYYFRSIYFRISNGILFEIATDGPGFTADEDLETLGEKLALPPFLEPQRERIEAGLKPIGA
ncbi:MAG: ring-cleaving dioxygenase [Chloroflexi bacterium]|nr:ring-cleaving dioxygenase [Chloroflexota bacterium]